MNIRIFRIFEFMSELNDSDKAEEPGLNYQSSKKIMVFNSFEKMNEEDARIAAETDPLENFRRVTELLKKMYAKELALPKNKTVYFKK